MSTQSPLGGRGAALFPVLPKGEVIATYETYFEAQEAVDKLAVADFPVNQVSIVGNDLKSVERVTGKLTYGRVALAGAASGAWMGVFFGLLFFIFSPTGANLPFVAAALLIGAGFGMLFGLVSFALNRRRRDFTSTMQVIAGNYQVIVDMALVHRARNLLAGHAEAAAVPVAPHPTEPAHPTEPTQPTEPTHATESTHPAPQYGESQPTSTTEPTPSPAPPYGESRPTPPYGESRPTPPPAP